jgi:hypothetical protein
MNFCNVRRRELTVWEPPTLKQVLAYQCRLQQLQCPLGRALLATACEDANLQQANQSQLHLHRDSLSGMKTATTSILAATPTVNVR